MNYPSERGLIMTRHGENQTELNLKNFFGISGPMPLFIFPIMVAIPFIPIKAW